MISVFNNKYNDRVKEILVERDSLTDLTNDESIFFVFIIALIAAKKFSQSYERIIEFLNFDMSDNTKLDYISSYIDLLIFQKQYYLAKKLLELEEYNLKEKLKPTWYALMTYMQDEYPNEIKKMGSELQESVNEIVKNIEELKKGK